VKLSFDIVQALLVGGRALVRLDQFGDLGPKAELLIGRTADEVGGPTIQRFG
jgi:hypothetical protein